MAYTKHILTSGTGYGSANGIRIAFGKSVPAANPNGKKHQLIIYLHGIDHRGPRPTSDTDFSTLDVVSNKGIPLQVKNAANIPFYIKPGGGADESYGTVVLFPQCSSEFSTWPFAYTAEMIKHAQNFMSDIVDLDRIHLFGYSLGGGGTVTATRDPFINTNIASFHAVATGYNASPNYEFVADSGVPVFVYHSATDPLALVSMSDTYVSQLNIRRPVHPTMYLRFSGATTGTQNHDDILPTLVRTVVTGAPYELSNGDIWVQNETRYETCLRFTKNRRKR